VLLKAATTRLVVSQPMEKPIGVLFWWYPPVGVQYECSRSAVGVQYECSIQ
jgi:hypothetical protein